MTNLVILAGIPGTGKSTFAKVFFDWYAVVSADVIRKRLAGTLRQAHQENVKPWDAFYAEIAQHLLEGTDVVADATFLTPKHRQRAREVADLHEAETHLVVFKNWLTAAVRNAERDEEHRVPGDAMTGMMKLYWDTLDALDHEDYHTVTRIESFG